MKVRSRYTRVFQLLEKWMQAGCRRLRSEAASSCRGAFHDVHILLLSLALTLVHCTCNPDSLCPQTLTGSFAFLAGAHICSAQPCQCKCAASIA